MALAAIGATAVATAADPPTSAQPRVGYKDTPLLPGGKWHVHDPDRPQPPAVDAGRGFPSSTAARPPSDAVVLFDGRDLSRWRTRDGKAPAWIIEDGVLEIPPAGQPDGGDLLTKQEFGDCQVHLEWATPNPPQGDLMNRGNSGLYFFGQYEVQIFDSFRGGIYADGQAGAIYGQYPPLVNASRAPGQWQSFDLLFTAPRFRGDQLETPAYVTVLHNGVCVHNHLAILGATGHRTLPAYRAGASKGPILLQAHGNPVRFRNIWVRELQGYDQAAP